VSLYRSNRGLLCFLFFNHSLTLTLTLTHSLTHTHTHTHSLTHSLTLTLTLTHSLTHSHSHSHSHSLISITSVTSVISTTSTTVFVRTSLGLCGQFNVCADISRFVRTKSHLPGTSPLISNVKSPILGHLRAFSLNLSAQTSSCPHKPNSSVNAMRESKE
jgi:hypothetical protein